MEGHASTIGGCVVDSGNFDWYQNDKFPGLTTPDESYHGVTYAKDFGKNGYIVKIVAQLLRDYGSTPSPFNSFLLNIGLESLAVRVERHCENAQKVAEYLEKNDKIAWVNYPGLKSSKDYELAKKYLPHGICGVISFGVKGGREKSRTVYELIKACRHSHARRRCENLRSSPRKLHSPSAFGRGTHGMRRNPPTS